MVKFTLFALFAQVLLIQYVYGQQCRLSNPGLGLIGNNNAALLNNVAYANNAGLVNNVLGNGAVLASNGYGGSGTGEFVAAGELPVGGNTQVSGNLPVYGNVKFDGRIPASGFVTISGNTPCIC